jgi:predicted metal-binding protein
MIKYVSYTVKQCTIDELLKYYAPKIVNKYCESCNKFSKIWSCPPLSFSDLEYVSKYKYCYIISGKTYISKIPNVELNNLVEHALSKYSDISSGSDEFSNTFNGLYYSFREINDNKVLSLESHFNDTTALFSGRCLICNNCSRSNDISCIFPNKLRYSLEGLGFDVCGIIENIVNDKIQWSNNSTPEYVTCVSGLLSNLEIPEEEIREILSSN